MVDGYLAMLDVIEYIRKKVVDQFINRAPKSARPSLTKLARQGVIVDKKEKSILIGGRRHGKL